MKRISFIFIFLILFMTCAPVFSLAASAPFSFHTTQSQPVLDGSHWYVVLAADDSDGVLVVFESDAIQFLKSGATGNYGIRVDSERPTVSFQLTKGGTFSCNLSYYDLKNGYLLSTETGSVSVSYFYGQYNFNWYPDRIFNLSEYITFPCYGYPLGDSLYTFSDYSNISLVDPFVVWNSSGGSGGGSVTPEPVDPTSVIRSRIPRPFGNNLVYYLADHEHLYSIFVGHPFSFESQGKIDTSLDPAEYEGEQYNQFSVMFSESGTGVNLRFTNKCQYPINCYINTYDVVDGSFIRSYTTTVNAGTLDSPSIHNYNLVLSDASTYGIYQSGFFSRDGITSYPELRISWSDTIDYSLDFFVLRSGVTTLVEGMASVIGELQTGNSTLTTISTTSAAILAKINSFYDLVDDNWDWFKDTYYNSILDRWDINAAQLDIIISLLEGNGETTYPEDESLSGSVDSYVSQEQSYFDSFNEAGSNADFVFDEAISQFAANSNGFSFLRNILGTFVFNIPSSYIIVFVSLTFGLVVMIMGRVVGGSKS